MAEYFVRSSTGDNLNNGLSWANAFATLAYAVNTIAAPGDRILVASDHDENTGPIYNLPDAGLAPLTIISVNASTGDPEPGAIASNGNNNCSVSGNGYFYGLQFLQSGTSNRTTWLRGAGASLVLEDCYFMLSNASNGSLQAGNSNQSSVDGSSVTLLNPTIEARNAGNTFDLGRAALRVYGGKTTGVAMNRAFRAMGHGGWAQIHGMEFHDSCASVADVSAGRSEKMEFMNCSIGPTASLVSGTSAGVFVDVYNTDSSTVGARFLSSRISGIVESDTGIYRTGGAEAADTPYSFEMMSNAQASLSAALETPNIARWNDLVGDELEVAVRVLSEDGAMFSNDLWMQVQYRGDSETSIFTTESTGGSPIADATALPASTSDWVGDSGLTNPVEHTLKINITPEQAGFIQIVVKMAKASHTVYVDPKLEITPVT